MSRSHFAKTIVISACVLLAVVEVPLTLRRPLTSDCILFDLEWRTLCRGGMPYRDIFQTNPPGTLWIHGAVRTLFGQSSEVLRAVDLIFMTSAIGLLALWTVRLGQSGQVAWAVGLFLFWMYTSQSIWCQCQRDGWMLGVSLLAMEIRWRRGPAPRLPQSTARWHCLTLLEGCLWGCAVWIKPFAIFPAVAVWLADRRNAASEQPTAAAFPGLFAGGLLIGAAGLAWMIAVGVWPHYWETNTEWNADYLASRRMSFSLLLALAFHFGPWSLLNLLAVAVLWMWWRERATPAPGSEARWLIGAFYLGWATQAFLLQHGHAYVHLPVLMIATTIVAGAPQLTGARLWWPAFALGILGIAIMSPLARFQTVSAWWRCVAGPVSPELRTFVRGPLDLIYPGAPDLSQLASIEAFLRSRNVRGGEVTCYSYSTMSLYRDLDIEPPCRFICPRIYANRFFVDRRSVIAGLLENSPQKYVVTDLVIERFSEEEANSVGPDGPLAPPPAFDGKAQAGVYPWSHPVVFRAGRYLVHEIRGPMGDFTSRPPRPKSIISAGN